jgi:hypothetical protein
MAIYPGNIIDSDSGEGTIIYPGIGIVRRLRGAARITTVSATSWPVYIRSRKLGVQDTVMTLPTGLTRVIGAAFGFYSKRYIPTQYTALGTELVGTSTNVLSVATSTEASNTVATATNHIGGNTITFAANTFVQTADVGVTKANYCDPFLGGTTVNPVIATFHTGGATVNLYNLTSTATLGTPGAGVVYSPQSAGFGTDPGYYDLPVVVDVLMPWSVQSLEGYEDAYDLSASGAFGQ